MTGNIDGRFAADIQMHEQRVASDRVHVLSERGQQTGEIRRTAGAGIPFLPHRFYMPFDRAFRACFRPDFQWIDVEIARAVLGHAAEQIIIQRLLHHVGIAAVFLHQQHPLRKHHQADRGACFRVHRVIRQIVIEGKRFAMRR